MYPILIPSRCLSLSFFSSSLPSKSPLSSRPRPTLKQRKAPGSLSQSVPLSLSLSPHFPSSLCACSVFTLLTVLQRYFAVRRRPSGADRSIGWTDGDSHASRDPARRSEQSCGAAGPGSHRPTQTVSKYCHSRHPRACPDLGRPRSASLEYCTLRPVHCRAVLSMLSSSSPPLFSGPDPERARTGPTTG